MRKLFITMLTVITTIPAGAYKDVSTLLDHCYIIKNSLVPDQTILATTKNALQKLISQVLNGSVSEEELLQQFKLALDPLFKTMYEQSDFAAYVEQFAKVNAIDLAHMQHTQKIISCWCALQIFYRFHAVISLLIHEVVESIAREHAIAASYVSFKVEFLQLYLTKQLFILQKAAVDRSDELLNAVD